MVDKMTLSANTIFRLVKLLTDVFQTFRLTIINHRIVYGIFRFLNYEGCDRSSEDAYSSMHSRIFVEIRVFSASGFYLSLSSHFNFSNKIHQSKKKIKLECDRRFPVKKYLFQKKNSNKYSCNVLIILAS